MKKFLSLTLSTSVIMTVFGYVNVSQATAISLGLTTANLSELTGEAASDLVGYSVASAGDVNNDGYDDFLIGANGNDDAGSTAGAAYLIYGQAAALTSASLSTAVQFTGEAAGDSAGISVASAGDVNNDGYDDFLIGATGNDDAVSSAGAAYLIYGQADNLTSASLNTAVQFTGEAAGDDAGISVASAGDVNNDGYDDFLIGAYFNDDVASDAGAAYLIYGQADNLTSASLNTAVQFTGEADGDNAGSSVSSAGDVNNDGFDDILIGAANNDDAAAGAGATYLIYGQLAPLSNASLSTAVQFTGEADGDNAGSSVSSAGDVNNDGYADLLIGARQNDDAGSNAGAVYLIYGQTAALTSASLSTAVQFTGEANGDNAGSSVSSAGDVNNDGYADFLIGARLNDDAAFAAGAAYLIYGQGVALTSASLSTAVQFTGEANGDNAGSSVSSAGDVNNDGYDDLLIGARSNDDAASDAGATYLVYAQSSTVTLTDDTTASNAVECGDTFTDPGATGTDQYTGSSLGVTTNDTVTSTTLGDQTVTYTAENVLSIFSSATRTVTVADTTAPTITRSGEATVTVEAGSTYTDAGATASDSCDSSVTVSTTGVVDTTMVGSYTLTYSAQDDSGNSATSATRTVTVEYGELSTVERSNNTVTITYANGHTTTVTPFGSSKKFYVQMISEADGTFIATNGKVVKLYQNLTKLDQLKIRRTVPQERSYFKLKTTQLYDAYTTGMVVVAGRTSAKLTVFRVTAGNELKKKVSNSFDIDNRQQMRITTNASKHRIQVTVGRSPATTATYRLTSSGTLRPL